MLELVRARLAQGSATIRFPDDQIVFPERFRGRPLLDCSRCAGARCPGSDASIPSALLHTRDATSDRAALDLGACLFAPEEQAGTTGCGVSFTHDYQMASRTRTGLVSPDGEIESPAPLEERMRRLLGRSLRLRSVVAGSCNGCEAELIAAGNIIFDLSRFGVQFVASPRHADGILITGAVNANMRDALERTYAAVPDPRIVIAVGACAASGGPFRGSDEAGTGVPPSIPVDLWIAGCPPHPLTILDGLLRLLGRVEGGSRSASR
jgi:Ni,Fe-hydrogenase III small subunit/formate hydrogenlyase subunit 6/NADH:ubiquinone oxidoreductase subunit I